MIVRCLPVALKRVIRNCWPLFLLALVVVALPACESHHDANPTQDTETFTVIGQNAVWPHPDIFNACHSSAEASRAEGCMIDALYRARADGAVINAVEQLSVDGDPGFVSHYRHIGKIGLVTLTHPFRANTNDETVLVGTEGALVYVDDTPLSHRDEQSQAYARLLDAFPGLIPFPPAQLNRVEQAADGGVSLRFDTPMAYCHACQPNAWLSLQYDFDPRGHFQGSHLIDVRRTGVD